MRSDNYNCDEEWSSNNVGLIISEHIEKMLIEGLIKTYPVNKLYNILSYYGKVQYVRPPEDRVITPEDKLPYGVDLKLDTVEYINRVLEIINTYGYYIQACDIASEKSGGNFEHFKKLSDYNNGNLEGIKEIWLNINPKFDRIKENENIQTLYHLTKKSNLGKILSKGLIPRSRNKKTEHPERIYVVTDKNHLYSLLPQFKKYDDTEYIILTINYNSADKPKLYYDTNYMNYGYYILDNISPKDIINIENAE